MKYLRILIVAIIIVLIVGYIVALITDTRRLQEIKNDKFERVDSVKLVDIHGNIIIIEENGKYTRFWKKNID